MFQSMNPVVSLTSLTLMDPEGVQVVERAAFSSLRILLVLSPKIRPSQPTPSNVLMVLRILCWSYSRRLDLSNAGLLADTVQIVDSKAVAGFHLRGMF
jgi:hypothetical protein